MTEQNQPPVEMLNLAEEISRVDSLTRGGKDPLMRFVRDPGNPQAGFKQVPFNEQQQLPQIGHEMLDEALWNIKRHALLSPTRKGSKERFLEALIGDPDMANTLRDSLRRIAFETYSSIELCWPKLTSLEKSDNPERILHA